MINDSLITSQEKEWAKLICQELDAIYNLIFDQINEINLKFNEINVKEEGILNINDHAKKIVLTKRLTDEYFDNNIDKHSIVYQSLHLLFFSNFKYAFNIIPIDEDFFIKMNSFEFKQFVLKWLDLRFKGCTDLINLVMMFCEIMLNLPLVKYTS